MLNVDPDWQRIVDKAQHIDKTIKHIQAQLAFTVGQMTKEIGNRHIIPAYQVEEETQNKHSTGTPQSKGKPLFET